MWPKRILYILLTIVIIITAYYFYWQKKKQGKGLDTKTHYELVDNWPKLPSTITLGNPAGIGIDKEQNIFVFCRAGREWPLFGSMPQTTISANTVLMLDRNTGAVLKSWGASTFIMPHGLTVDDSDNVWVTDVALQQVFKFSHDGKLIMRLGEKGVAGKDASHFDQPTDVTVAKDGSFYVSDGYGNSRISKFSADGNFLFDWGVAGSKDSQFDVPHAVCLDDSGRVYVADRENNRIQVFDSYGRFIKQWTDESFGSICSVVFDKSSKKFVAVDDARFLKIRHAGSDVFIFDTTGKVQTRFGRSGDYKGSRSWYHDVAVDSEGNIYVGDILNDRVQKFKKIN